MLRCEAHIPKLIACLAGLLLHLVRLGPRVASQKSESGNPRLARSIDLWRPAETRVRVFCLHAGSGVLGDLVAVSMVECCPWRTCSPGLTKSIPLLKSAPLRLHMLLKSFARLQITSPTASNGRLREMILSSQSIRVAYSPSIGVFGVPEHVEGS